MAIVIVAVEDVVAHVEAAARLNERAFLGGGGRAVRVVCKSVVVQLDVGRDGITTRGKIHCPDSAGLQCLIVVEGAVSDCKRGAFHEYSGAAVTARGVVVVKGAVLDCCETGASRTSPYCGAARCADGVFDHDIVDIQCPSV